MSAPAPEPAQAPVGAGVPWEQRQSHGFVKAYVDTWVKAVTQPTQFFAGAGPTRGFVDALLFAWLTYALGSIPEVGLRLAMGAGAGMQELVGRLLEHPAMGSGMRSVFEAMVAGSSPVATVVSSAVGVVFFPVVFLVSAGTFHVCALLLGAGKGGFEGTARALGYAWAPMVFAFVPCLPALYLTALLVVGLMHLHETTSSKATATVLLPGVLSTCCLCGISAVAAGFAASLFNQVH